MIATGLATLKQYSQFIVYCTELNAITGKLNKIATVSVTEPSKWMSYDAACTFPNQHPDKLFVGFVLRSELSRTAVVDVDGCRDKDTGKLSDLALTIIAMLPGAYVEVSISGTGIHIWFSYSGDMPPHACRANGLEFYHGIVEVDLTAILPALIATFFPPAPSSASGETQEWTDGPCEDWNGPADDGELLRRPMRTISAAAAFNPDEATFSDLWEANEAKLSRAYPDPKRPYDASAADAALAQHLAFWTGNDCERIKQIMERSSLARDKWERGNYLTRTVLNAVARQTETLQDKRSRAAVEAPVAGGIMLTPIERVLGNVGTQDAIALIFTQRMKRKMIYDRTRNSWMEYDGTRWRKDQLGKAYNLVRNICRKLTMKAKPQWPQHLSARAWIVTFKALPSLRGRQINSTSTTTCSILRQALSIFGPGR
jgi:primase-polymerase (primpol)-like protein